MAIEIRMPELSADTQEADLIAWLVKPGDQVSRGDVIAEIETEKATVELEADADGVVSELLVAEGTTGVAVGTVLAILEGAEGAEVAQGVDTKAATPTLVPTPEPTPAPAPRAEPRPVREEPTPESGDVAATALARRVASQAGVDLSVVEGSGARGRIRRADVDAAAQGGRAASASASSQTDDHDTPHRLVRHSRMRRTIAARLSEAKRTIPHFYLRNECRIDRLLEVRRSLNSESDDPQLRLSVNDFVVRAAALALVEVPAANVAWSEDGMLHFERVDMAVAVATDGGLVTPILRGADRKGLRDLSTELKELASRARSGKLSPEEYRGGTFCVSNLGMYGVESVAPIVNPPQAAILGVGAGQARPIVQNGEIVPATLMTCTLSADHRAVDGAVGAQWMSALQRRLEEPLEMLL